MDQNSQICTLRPKQIEALSFYMRNPRGANTSDPATGKTAPSNVWMYGLWDKYKCKSVFLMPTSLFKQNYKSFFKFTNFEADEVVLLRGTVKQRRALMANPRGKVFIASFDFFAPKGKQLDEPSEYDELRKFHTIGAVFVDEWHRGFKSIASRRTQGLLFSLQWIPLLIPLTGTACDGHLDSVYPMIHAIEPRYYMNHQDFLNQHAIKDFHGSRVIGWKNVEKVKEILARHSIRHSFEEVYGKDETILEPQEFEMDPKHRALYDDYESTGLFDTEEGWKEAAHGGEMVIRLRQLCNCPEKLVEDLHVKAARDLVLTKDEGIATLLESAIQTNKQVLVFAAFKHEQRRIAEMVKDMGGRVAVLNGDVKQGAPREKIEEDFREKRLDFVVASPDLVEVGFDWPDIDIVIFYSMSYRDTSFIQGYRRGVRGKRVKPLLVYLLYYVKSVEEDVIHIVEGKMDIANQTDPTRTVFQLIKKRHKNLKVSEEKPKGEYKKGRTLKIQI